MGNFSLVVVPPYDLLRLDYVLARAVAEFDNPVPVSLLLTSLGMCLLLGFVLPHPFIPLVYFARVLPVLFMSSRVCWFGVGCATTLSSPFLTSWRGCLSSSPGSSLLPLFPFALSSSLRSELLSAVALLWWVCSWILLILFFRPFSPVFPCPGGPVVWTFLWFSGAGLMP